MGQTTYNAEMSKGVAGLVSETRYPTIITRKNGSKMKSTFEVTATTSLVSMVVNSTSYQTNSASASLTKSAIASTLVTAVNAGESDLIATYSSATITIEAEDVGDSFTLVSSAGGTATNIITNATAAIPFGRFVIDDQENADRAYMPTTSASLTAVVTNLLGVTARDIGIENTDSSTGGSNAGYPINKEMAILTEGKIYVELDGTDTPVFTDTVYIRHVASGTAKIGQVSGTSAAGENVAIDKRYVRFAESAASGDTSILCEINLRR